MNKNLGISVVVIVLILIGAGVFSSKKDTTESMVKSEVMESNEATAGDSMMKEKEEVSEGESMMKKEVGDAMEKTDTMMKVGTYEAYSPEKIAKASTGDVVLFFRASWCPTCIAVDKDIKANLEEIPAGLVILDVNYDNSTELKKKYGVTYQHTFVQVDKDGNLIKKWSGSPTLAKLVVQVQ